MKNDEFKKFLDKIVKPEDQEKVKNLLEEGKEKVEYSVEDVKHFFDKIGDSIKEDSKDLYEKAKSEIEKHLKK